jgi:hypothetical protein
MSYGHQGCRGERWPLRLARLEEATVDHHHLHVWIVDPHALQLHPAPAVHRPLTGVIGVAGRPRDVWGVDAGATLDRVNDPWAGLVDPREAHVREAEAVIILIAAREAHRAARPHPPRRRDIAPTHARLLCAGGDGNVGLMAPRTPLKWLPNGSQPAQKRPIFRQSWQRSPFSPDPTEG